MEQYKEDFEERMIKRKEELDKFERNLMGPEYKGKLGKIYQILKRYWLMMRHG